MKYYLKIRGSIRGPFEPSQIATFIQQGKIGKYNELSPDGKRWAPASEFSEFFQRVATKSNSEDDLAVVESADEPRPFEADLAFDSNQNERQRSKNTKSNSNAKTDENDVWFVSNDGVTGTGPYSAREIWRLLEKGKATPNSLVWLEGLPARPLKDVPEFGKAKNNVSGNDVNNPTSAGVALQGETRCPKCAASIPSEATFCSKCGAAKPSNASGPTRKCPRCKINVALGAKVCPKCGRSLLRRINKLRLIYFISGIFGGCFGAHNFYARRFEEGRRQLTLLILGVAFLVLRGFAPDILSAIPNGDRINLGRLDLLLKIFGSVSLGLLGLWVFLNLLFVSEDGDGTPFDPIIPINSGEESDEDDSRVDS